MILQNNFLTVEIATFGAEIKSILDNQNNEWMWNANPNFWGKTSPILFPIVGSLKNNTFIYKGENYSLSRHGFARDMEFDAEQVSKTKAIFTLKANEKTLVNYPFYFELNVIYELQNKQLVCIYEVANVGNEIMYFSIGGHPAFALGKDATDFENFYLEFNNDTSLNRLKLVDGLISENKEIINLNNQQLPLHYDLFKEDAMVFRDLKSNVITIKNTKNENKLTLKFDDFTHFGIWTVQNAPFICLEPWFGMADLQNHNQHIEDKEGMIALAPQQVFTESWKVSIDS